MSTIDEYFQELELKKKAVEEDMRLLGLKQRIIAVSCKVAEMALTNAQHAMTSDKLEGCYWALRQISFSADPENNPKLKIVADEYREKKQ